MKLSKLFKNAGEEIGGTEILSLAFSTAKVEKGSLYFCISGTKTDGHNYAENAIASGAAAIVTERLLPLDIPQIVVQDTRSALSKAASKFFGEPSKKLKMIAVTGTNGKTTTTYILEKIMQAAGKKCGIIGTNAIIIGDKRIDANLTTPDPIELHSILKTMLECGMEYVVMEASAHALELRKLDGIVFDVAAFTNFSQDHLDFFDGMESYFAAKKKLFSQSLSRFAVINSDDKKAPQLIDGIKIPYLTYGALNPADVFAMDLIMSVEGIKYLINVNDNIGEVRFALPGKFNMYNTLCAASIAYALKFELKDILDGIRSLTKVDGRFNIINTSKCSIIIDFAHTADGLKNILSTIREFAPKKIITVFGCGGDRDRTKRPQMGGVVTQLSDYSFITSDNPRTEDPLNIISDILKGVNNDKKESVYIEADRKNAILNALEYASEGDIILVAGKGAEKYQDIMGIKQGYNDEEYILKLIEEKKI